MTGSRKLPEGSGFDRRRATRNAKPPRGSGFVMPRFLTSIISLVIAALIVSVLGGVVLELLDSLNPPPKGPLVESSADTLKARFSMCAGSIRINCVADGDTFWFRGIKLRIADIDAPEIYPPHCEREEKLGNAAKERLLVLLNGGRFSLVTVRDERDRFGRTLRRVTRGGRSIGDVLIAEGLARRGPRRSWCD